MVDIKANKKTPSSGVFSRQIRTGWVFDLVALIEYHSKDRFAIQIYWQKG